MNLRKELALKGLKLGALRLNTTTPFIWASGYSMPVYNDNRIFMSDPEARDLISRGFEEVILENELQIDVIAGTSTSGIPLATSLADRLSLPLTYVRDKAKKHGLNNRIEGLGSGGDYNKRRVLLIEDLISTGGSSIDALMGIREANGLVENCLALFSYSFDAADENFSRLNPPAKVISLLDYKFLIETALEENYLGEEERKSLEEWREAPFDWGEERGFKRRNK